MSGALELALSASGTQLLCALRTEDGTVLLPEEPLETRAALLPVLVHDLLDHARRDPSELSDIRLDLGPGSYTGIRVALTFARTLAHFCQTRLATFTSAELLALDRWRAGDLAGDRTLRLIRDARQQRFQVSSLHRLESGRVELLEAPQALSWEEALASVAVDDVLLTEALLIPRLAEVFGDRNEILTLREISPELLFDPGLCPENREQPELVEPLYLMGSYAENDRQKPS